MRGKARKLPTAPSSVSVERIGLLTTWRSPVPRLRARLSVDGDAWGGILIPQIAMMTATKDNALTTKQAVVPPRASKAPAITGPTARERLNCSEFKATAFGM